MSSAQQAAITEEEKAQDIVEETTAPEQKKKMTKEERAERQALLHSLRQDIEFEQKFHDNEVKRAEQAKIQKAEHKETI